MFHVADPAFLMDPVKPRNDTGLSAIHEGAIGINLSPLLAYYVTGGDFLQWERIAANIVSNVAKKTSRPLYLIPHVTTPVSNDFLFLEKVWNRIDPQIQSEIKLIPPHYNAVKYKMDNKSPLPPGRCPHPCNYRGTFILWHQPSVLRIVLKQKGSTGISSGTRHIVLVLTR